MGGLCVSRPSPSHAHDLRRRPTWWSDGWPGRALQAGSRGFESRRLHNRRSWGPFRSRTPVSGLEVAERTADSVVRVTQLVLRDSDGSIVGSEDKVLLEDEGPKRPVRRGLQ